MANTLQLNVRNESCFVAKVALCRPVRKWKGGAA